MAKEQPMVEINKVITYIPLLYQTFDDKNKSVKGANNNQVYMPASFYASVFCMIRIIVIYDIITDIYNNIYYICLWISLISLYAAILYLMITISKWKDFGVPG